MNNQERDLITQFIARVGGPGTPAPGQGSVPATTQPLPPIDREADALIADLFTRYPDARYRITQMAFVQEHALIEAQNRINRLQWELNQARAQQQAAPQPDNSPWGQPAQPQPESRGLFSSLFGSRQSAPPPNQRYAPQYGQAPGPQYGQQPQYAPPPPPLQYPPGYAPGMFQQQGPGFFGSALRTAAGVAGGVVAANALMGLFSGGHEHGGLGGIGSGFAGTAGEAASGFIPAGLAGAASPWGSDPMDQGGALKDEGGKFDGPAQVDQGGWQDASANAGGGWQPDNSSNSSSGWEPDPNQDAADQGGGWTDDSGSSDDQWT